MPENTKSDSSKPIRLDLNLSTWDLAVATELYRIRLLIETIPDVEKRVLAIHEWTELYELLIRPVTRPL